MAASDFRETNRPTEEEDIKKALTQMLYTATHAFILAAKHKESLNDNNKIEIHTGNWGGGAFKNNTIVVVQLQIIAAMVASNQVNNTKICLNYYPFGTEKVDDEINRLQDHRDKWKLLEKWKNGELLNDWVRMTTENWK